MEQSQPIMPNIFVKVSFKSNIYNFGKYLRSYQELVQSVLSRKISKFSELKKLSFYFKEQIVNESNFNTLIKLQSDQGKKSIKLELKGFMDQDRLEKNPSKSKTYSFNPNQIPKQSKKYSFSLEDSDEERQDSQKKQLQEQFQVLNLGQEQSKSTDPSKINIKPVISKEQQCIQTKLDGQYFWKCSLENLSGFDIQCGLFIKDLSTQNLTQVKNMKNLEKRQFILGPYAQKQLGKHLHFYQILYKENEKQHILIGKKFGFIADTKKQFIVKEIQNKVVQRVNKVKSFCVCQKTTQYIVKAMKQLNITDDTIDGYKDQDLIELIESLNTH